MASKEARVYDLIEKKAGSNIAMQALSGMVGFPFTAMADVAVFFTHYGPMLNEIRSVYGRTPVSIGSVADILKGCKTELLTDLVFDKVVGNIPLIGMPANMICAKAMTWRLGILFGMLAARGEEINRNNVASAIRMIRELFPQKKSFMFQKPSVIITERLLTAVEGDSFEDFNEKMCRILEAMAG